MTYKTFLLIGQSELPTNSHSWLVVSARCKAQLLDVGAFDPLKSGQGRSDINKLQKRRVFSSDSNNEATREHKEYLIYANKRYIFHRFETSKLRLQPNIGAAGELLTIWSEIAFILWLFSCNKWTTTDEDHVGKEDDGDDDDVAGFSEMTQQILDLLRILNVFYRGDGLWWLWIGASCEFVFYNMMVIYLLVVFCTTAWPSFCTAGRTRHSGHSVKSVGVSNRNFRVLLPI